MWLNEGIIRLQHNSVRWLDALRIEGHSQEPLWRQPTETSIAMNESELGGIDLRSSAEREPGRFRWRGLPASDSERS